MPGVESTRCAAISWTGPGTAKSTDHGLLNMHVHVQEPAAESPHGYIAELQTAFLTAGLDAEQAQTSRMRIVDQLCGAYRCSSV
jgi:hypothetical protein